jgi:uncharacterized protein YbbK (DUF523 family)/ribosomal protein S18 acetylase RimI-like enzyme
MEIVSACLVGVACRHDCGSRIDPALAARFALGDVFPLCPELLGGLGLPRPPAEILGGTGEDVLDGSARVVDGLGSDVTGAFIAGAEASLRLARAVGATEAFLAGNSPSCGSGFVYDGSFSGRLLPGDGVTAALFARNGIRPRRVERARAEKPSAADARNDAEPAAGRPILRRARPGDCGELARLAAELGYPCDEDAVRVRIEMSLARDDTTVIVAQLGGELVGWTNVDRTERFYLDPFAEITGFVVDQRYRGRGLGKLIMAEAELWAASRSLKLIRLKANVTRLDAHRFYEGLGFERTKAQYAYVKRL